VTSYVHSSKRARLYKIEPLAVRFWAKVNREGPVPVHRSELGPCWIWLGSTDGKGYGEIRKGGRGTPLLKAHRVAWELAHGPIPVCRMVLHGCDRPRCVRVAHLFLGDAKANSADMDAKGRRVTRPVRGEQVASAKLTETKVQEIRQFRRSGWSQPRLAKHFGVSQMAIWSLLAGRTWKAVP